MLHPDSVLAHLGAVAYHHTPATSIGFSFI